MQVIKIYIFILLDNTITQYILYILYIQYIYYIYYIDMFQLHSKIRPIVNNGSFTITICILNANFTTMSRVNGKSKKHSGLWKNFILSKIINIFMIIINKLNIYLIPIDYLYNLRNHIIYNFQYCNLKVFISLSLHFIIILIFIYYLYLKLQFFSICMPT